MQFLTKLSKKTCIIHATPTNVQTLLDKRFNVTTIDHHIYFKETRYQVRKYNRTEFKKTLPPSSRFRCSLRLNKTV